MCIARGLSDYIGKLYSTNSRPIRCQPRQAFGFNKTLSTLTTFRDLLHKINELAVHEDYRPRVLNDLSEANPPRYIVHEIKDFLFRLGVFLISISYALQRIISNVWKIVQESNDSNRMVNHWPKELSDSLAEINEVAVALSSSIYVYPIHILKEKSPVSHQLKSLLEEESKNPPHKQ